ncbi:MAG: hypothetical protein EOL87_15190 [Spartobacteria bacterium]|nr:hypothetical protein [Spartobacteria bacterium]
MKNSKLQRRLLGAGCALMLSPLAAFAAQTDTDAMQAKMEMLERQYKMLNLQMQALKDQMSMAPLQAAEEETLSEKAMAVAQEALDKANGFEFHGYSRAGFGWNGKGGAGNRYRWQYGASGLDEHYWRLGNESHNCYTALQLIHNWEREDESFVKFNASIVVEPEGEDNWEPVNVVVRQLFAEMGNFTWAPDITFWAGQKWYRHPGDNHITDWQFMDIAGYGGGVGDIPLGGYGKFSIAMLGAMAEENVFTDNGRPTSSLIDLRIEEIPVGIGNLTLQIAPTWTEGGTVTSGDEALIGKEMGKESGWSSTVMLNIDGFFGLKEGGYSRFIARYGSKLGSPLFMNRFIKSYEDDEETAINWDKAYRYSLSLDGLVEFSENFQFMPVIAYQYYDNGLDNNNIVQKLLYGGRFKYSVTDNIALQFEPGAIMLNSETATFADGGHLDDTLWKFTPCITIQPDPGFWVRPEIRFFVTYATWGEKESAQYLEDTNGIDVGEDTSSWTYGMQMEAWF